MDRFASLRFDTALDECERSAVARAIESAGGGVMTWATVAERSYVAIYAPPGLQGHDISDAVGAARFDDPALVVLAIKPTVRAQMGKLVTALESAVIPAGAGSVTLMPDAVIVEVVDGRGSMPRILASIDDALSTNPGRQITALLPLDDDVTASIAAERLREPDLDGSRVLDRYVEILSAPGVWS